MLSISEALSLAFQQYQAGSREQAKQLCAKILEKSPNHADTLHLLGILKYQAGNVAEALDLYQQVLKLMPDNPDAHSNLGMVLRQQGKVADAIAHYRQAIRLRPKSAAFHNNLSVALNQVGNTSEALEHWQEAIRLNPDYTEALIAAGNVLIKQGNFSTGINYWRRAVKLKPNSMKLHNDLGMALKEQGLLTEARYHLEEAVALKPDSAEVITNLGSVYKEENLLAEAKQQYQKALSLKANFAEAHFNLGLVYLLQGDLKQGFTEYSWRWQIPGQNINPIPKPLWDGSSLAGKTILLHTEQGFGDAIQFIRYASIIARQGGKVVVGCPTALVRLFQTVPGIEKVATQTTELPAFDCHAPLMKLPQILGTTLETIPNQVPYLFVTGKEQESKQSSSNLPYKIGIVWAAGVRGADSQKRSCALPNLVQGLLNVPGIELYSLQKEPNEADLQFLQSSGIIDLRAQLNDFADTAEAISQLDLVISVDTAVAHLAGAMGKPVWILLPFAPDWRWMLARDDTPWYPSMRLFRQPAPGEWEAVFTQVKQELQQLAVTSEQLSVTSEQLPVNS
ncbi:MAG: tetratricopeptide repeat protein, partial [Oscillatoria sp. PMC 1051.18]|nr:tetratricopeptide repeat protein [Oscillatoria sp. PMC 1051.18]